MRSCICRSLACKGAVNVKPSRRQAIRKNKRMPRGGEKRPFKRGKMSFQKSLPKDAKRFFLNRAIQCF